VGSSLHRAVTCCWRRAIGAVVAGLGLSCAIGVGTASAVTWDHRIEVNGSSQSSCRYGEPRAGYINFIRWEDGYPYTICMLNYDANLSWDSDLRSSGDVFLDGYYVGMNSSSSVVNTRYIANNFGVNFWMYTGTSCTGSIHTVFNGDNWATSGFKVAATQRSGETGC
jgi:hypothetical protein